MDVDVDVVWWWWTRAWYVGTQVPSPCLSIVASEAHQGAARCNALPAALLEPCWRIKACARSLALGHAKDTAHSDSHSDIHTRIHIHTHTCFTALQMQHPPTQITPLSSLPVQKQTQSHVDNPETD